MVRRIGICMAVAWAALSAVPALAQTATTTVPSFRLPLSPYLSPEARRILAERANEPAQPPPASIAEQRARTDAVDEVKFARVRELYPVKIEEGVMGGVPVRTITPAAGVQARNQNRVLINAFGGAFVTGARYSGLLESAPVAAIGGYRVVTVSYRLSPESHFPAARDDLVAVYTALLKTYRPENIGIFGCSSGGSLVGQAVARLITTGVPTPRAVAILCSGLLGMGGDSAIIAPALTGQANPNVGATSGAPALPENEDPNYFRGVRPGDPAAWPGFAPDVLRRFPPTMIMAAGRGFELSQAVQSHNLLIKAGVPAELNVWEGLAHGFYSDPALPESREVHERIVRFFDMQFGNAATGRSKRQ